MKLREVLPMGSCPAMLCALIAAAPALGGELCPPAHLTPPEAFPFISFGWSVGVSGQRAIVGAWTDFGGTGHLFRHDQGKWVPEQDLLAGSDTKPKDDFGFRVAIDGDVAMVTALNHIHPGAPGSGSVYVFRRKGERWLEEQELLASTGSIGDGFGFSTAIDGDRAIVGAPGDDELGQDTGAAYIYRFNMRTGDWVEEQKLLVADGGKPGEGLGFAVDIQGDLAVLGATGNDDLAGGAGAVYVFRRDSRAGQWSQEQKLLPDKSASRLGDDNFGYSVAVSDSPDAGPVVLIGAKNDDEPKSNSGSAYVFRFDGSNWVQEQELLEPQVFSGSQFGRAVDLDGNLAIIGAWASDAVAEHHGAAYIFHYNAKTAKWELAQTMLPAVSESFFPFFGWSVGIDDQTVIVGAYGEEFQSGSAYIARVDLIGADLNCDQLINGFDLAMLLATWGPVGKGKSARGSGVDADLNDDGVVDGLDVAMLLGEWG